MKYLRRGDYAIRYAISFLFMFLVVCAGIGFCKLFLWGVEFVKWVF